MKKTRPLSVKIEEPLWQAIDKASRERGIGFSHYCRLALKKATGYKDPKETI